MRIISKCIILLLVLQIPNILAQNANIESLSNSIFDTKTPSDKKVKAMSDLMKLYKTSGEKDCAKIEAVFIRATNFSSMLFFHEFESKLPTLLKSLKLDIAKKIRLFIIVSAKFDGIDYKYFKPAIEDFQKYNISNNLKLKIIDCDSTNLINSIAIKEMIKKQKIAELNNYYLSLIISCPESVKEIKKVRKYYFSI